ncbi:hypothetical protein [Xylanimonas ulmi]|uniref:Hemagglutinin n=1 Tax=Xylanimonas ulmi TaxID=228973 RepID=A0A4Q7M0T5_9MICO|nr:hypothetical protein [Xylanibacterium ulmi]RZS59958.1 hypothetical protein EV386_0198 [Xylanibacterium ulmi]
MTSTARRALPAALATTLSAALLLVTAVLSTGTATAAPITDFDPGYIISDAVMYDSRSMSAAQVAQFIATQGANCRPSAGNTCLKDYRETTPTRPASALCASAYTGASGESAATIISKVGAACGINPQVLLVTLQKEQGLVTATTGKPASTYARALGFGCPDNAGGVCDGQYAGFANQVYSAAQQLQRYAANPNAYAHRPGAVNNIRYSPNASCGTSPVYIQNQATASLYNYTPYQPNAAALAAGTGTGDACSSYGNRNFHTFFKQWFGSPTGNRTPFGNLDLVQATTPGTIYVGGWAIDPDVSSIPVHVYIDGAIAGQLMTSSARPDVAAIYGNARAGYGGTFTVTAGQHNVCAYAINSPAGLNALLGCSTVTVTNRTPLGVLDVVTAGPGAITVGGWAFDPDTTSPIPVHIYVDGKITQGVVADGARQDVANAFGGMGATSGFMTTFGASDGTHRVCAYAINVPAGLNVETGCRTVTVRNATPIGVLDIVDAASPQNVRVAGWAYDADSTAPIGVRVRVDGAVVHTATADASRPDVGKALGVRDATGFDTTVALTAGSRQICVDALDAPTGAATAVGCRTVTVPNTPPTGAITDAAADVSGTAPARLVASGWAWDYDVTTPVTVRLAVDGVAVGQAKASATVSPIPAGAGRATVGWSLTTQTSPGTRQVCATAVDSPTGVTASLGCASVDVPNRGPFGSLDVVSLSTSNGSSSLQVAGWAIDPDTSAFVAVDVYVGGVYAGSGVANRSRPDVEAAIGLGANRGFDITVPVTSGAKDVRVYFINSPNDGVHPSIGWPSTIAVP